MLYFQSPIQLQDEKTICCWCCADGPITMDVYLERCAFVVGESIKLRIEVSNLANESLEQIKVGLKNVSRIYVNSASEDFALIKYIVIVNLKPILSFSCGYPNTS